MEQRKGSARWLVPLCVAVYFTSYVTRINLAAVLVVVVETGFAAKTTVAMALTVCAVVYGLGQLISGYLGDRCKPQHVISLGFVLTAAMNWLVGGLHNEHLLVLIWGINGFAQALMWPPLVRILSERMPLEEYQKACVWVVAGSAAATVAVYLLSPVVIRVLGLRWVFYLAAAAGAVMFFLWTGAFPKVGGSPSEQRKPVPRAQKAETARMGPEAIHIFAGLLLCVVLEGFLRDGVINWTPSFISDTFGLDASVSVLTGVILPVFTVFSNWITSYVYRRYLNNELICCAFIFAAGTAAAGLLAAQGEKSMVLSLLLLALLEGSMHGIGLLLTGMVPMHFVRFGRTSMVSGIINAGVYVGSALSAWGLALWSEAFGWNWTLLLWMGLCIVGTAVCWGFSHRWRIFTGAASR